MEQFKFKELELQGVYLINSFYTEDNRGAFIKDYNINIFKENGIEHELKETFYTISKKGVIRALHFQKVKEQAKLIRCIKGHIYDVVVDLRPNSPTFKKWIGVDLTGENHLEIFVPEHFGHGYLVLEDSVVSYKCGEVFYGEYDTGIKWNDEIIGIEWPVELVGGKNNIILSEKDKQLCSFEEFFGLENNKELKDENYST